MKKDKLPTIQRISMQVHTSEGTTCTNWMSNKKHQKSFGVNPDPVEWFRQVLTSCKSHYNEGMGG